ncbi:transporter [Conyzicola nivalis]|uniref:Transporter n=1 Tax=Conyzicola nivalis TaxID=1477021 RepID=A0A916SGL0_9MICO|nr:hypothetical protein [Conyzicola nivalis]GGA96463.1 transporter [Conyzicola nivalis]
MDRFGLAAIVLGALVVFLALIALGWYSRKRRQRGIAAPQQPPAHLGAVFGEFPGFYVATTLANDRFNRVAVHGLGFRAKSTVVVAEAGIVVPIAGQPDIFIPRGDIALVDRATWTIDRVVETDGLTMIAWALADTEVESYFRAENSEAFLAAAKSLALSPTERDSK